MRTWRALLISALLSAGCSGPEYANLPDGSRDVVSDGGLVTATIDLSSAEPVRGTNQMWLSFQPESAQVEVTEASASLAATGEESVGTIDAEATPVSVSLPLTARGSWQVQIGLTVDDAPDAQLLLAAARRAL